jgi:hypothetical protein
MIALADADMKGLRDRAILLLGFAGAFRRSYLVALDVTDLEFCDGGMRVHVRRSKTDQEGETPRRPFAPVPLPHIGRRARRLDLQNDGPEPP